MNDDYGCSPDELAKKAANPDSMGGHGQPNGRYQEDAQERDSNHPQGSGNHRPGIETSG